jgi:hypothetical protein
MSARHLFILAIVLLLLANCSRPTLSGITVTCPPELIEGEAASVGVSIANNTDHASDFTVAVSLANYLVSFSAKPRQICSEELVLPAGESGEMTCDIDEVSNANLIRVDVTSADGKFRYTCPVP